MYWLGWIYGPNLQRPRAETAQLQCQCSGPDIMFRFFPDTMIGHFLTFVPHVLARSTWNRVAQALEAGWATLPRTEYMQNNFGLKGKTNLFLLFSIVIRDSSLCSGMLESLSESGTILPCRRCFFFDSPLAPDKFKFVPRPISLAGRHRWGLDTPGSLPPATLITCRGLVKRWLSAQGSMS
jgi:hypothetical protein